MGKILIMGIIGLVAILGAVTYLGAAGTAIMYALGANDSPKKRALHLASWEWLWFAVLFVRLFIYRRTGGDFDADTGYYKGFTIIRQVADKKGKNTDLCRVCSINGTHRH